ncbi:MAG: ATP-grasp domain-containing protein [Algicola sp.]|nr:ATP-grasp domain-containing protein [Algicola sp.]
MTTLFIVPEGVIYYSDLKDWLRAIKTDAVLLTTNEKRIGKEKLLSDYPFCHVETFDNYYSNGLIEVRAMELHKQYKFERLVTVTEFDIIRSAMLRDELGIEGQGLDSANHFRDKFLMRDLACKAGLASPKYAKVNNVIDLLKFLQRVDLPIVVKPRDLAGTVGANVLKTEEDVEQFLSQRADDIHKSPTGSISETFVKGLMYHVDGFIHNGKEVVMLPSKYNNDGFAFFKGENLGSHALSDSNPLKKRLNDFARKICFEVLPTPQNMVFHLEVFHTPDDELVMCEIASRLGGGRINDTVKAVTGYDIKMGFVEAEANKGLEVIEQHQQPSGKLAGWLTIPQKEGTIEYIPEECPLEGVIGYRLSGKAGDKFDAPSTMGFNLVNFVIEGETELEVANRMEGAAQWFDETTIWITSQEESASA